LIIFRRLVSVQELLHSLLLTIIASNHTLLVMARATVLRGSTDHFWP